MLLERHPALLLAQINPDWSSLRTTISNLDILNRPEELLEQLGQMPVIGAAASLTVGLLCVLNGYKWHKWVIIILALLFGLMFGHLLSLEIGRSAVVAIAIGLLCAILAIPMMKFAVAIFGGLTGAFIGANAWTYFNEPYADVSWTGALMGFVIVAMASFILFRLVIVLFMSLGGAVMLVFGAITLLLHVEDWEPSVREHLSANQAIVPLLVAVAAVAGFVWQQSKMVKDAPKPAGH